jgi:hypothetical protein
MRVQVLIVFENPVFIQGDCRAVGAARDIRAGREGVGDAAVAILSCSIEADKDVIRKGYAR